MLELTHRNHFKFGYNGQSFNDRLEPDDTWNVAYGTIERLPENIRVESRKAAEHIADKAGGQPIWVMFSGGCDSEVVIRAFQDARIPVRAAICRFKDDLNIHDTSYAVIACNEMHVPYKFIELDILKFFDNGAYDYAKQTNCASSAMLQIMWAMDQVDGIPVVGSGECYLERQPMFGPRPPHGYGWAMLEKERIAGLYRYFMKRNRLGVAGFFQYTPELMLSFLEHPITKKLVNNEFENKRYKTTLNIKNDVYYEHFRSMIRRIKFTGYEKFSEAHVQLENELNATYEDYNQVSMTEYSELVTNLRGAQV